MPYIGGNTGIFGLDDGAGDEDYAGEGIIIDDDGNIISGGGDNSGGGSGNSGGIIGGDDPGIDDSNPDDYLGDADIIFG